MSQKKKTPRMIMIILKATATAKIAKIKIKMRRMIVTMKKVTKMDIVETTNVLKNNGSVSINKTQFEFGLRCAKNVDKMTDNTDTLTVQLNILVTDTIFCEHWDKAGPSAKKNIP